MRRDTYNEGYDAFENGMSEEDNPHAEGTDAAEDWQKGFEAAEDDAEAEENDDDN